jgi:hypothetical protein
MRHYRAPKLIEIPASQIPTDPDAGSDTMFVRLYQQLIVGKINTSRTRLPISHIASGYYERRAGEIMQVSSLNPKHVAIMEREIRGGSRPELVLYWNPIAPNGGAYVCSDDEAALAAYRKLNFSLVPCSILRPKKMRGIEACIWLKDYGRYTGIDRVIPPNVNNVPMFAHDSKIPFSTFVEFLVKQCKQTRKSILLFHRQNRSDMHYHQMLYAFVRRHERLLDSTSKLIALGRAEHAEALIRLAYEAFLNFYIDWLSPEFFGPRLQLLSAIRAAQAGGHKLGPAPISSSKFHRVSGEYDPERRCITS